MTSSLPELTPLDARPADEVRVASSSVRGSRSWAAGAAVAGAVVLVLCLAALAVGALAGRHPAATSVETRVHVVGDSLVHQARQPIAERLARAGFTADVAGLPGQSLNGSAVRGELDDASREGGGVLVLATTANDARANAQIDGGIDGAPTYRHDIVKLVSRFHDRCVVIVNSRDRMNAVYQPERAALLNRELAGLDPDVPGLVVVDWATISRDLPLEWFASDLLHFGEPIDAEQPDSPSAKLYAEAIADGVSRCPH